MHIDGQYLFGTTRSVESNRDGEKIYIWRVTLESTNNFVETNSLIGSRIQLDDTSAKRVVSGIHKKLLGINSDVIHLVFFDDHSDELWYMKASLEGTCCLWQFWP